MSGGMKAQHASTLSEIRAVRVPYVVVRAGQTEFVCDNGEVQWEELNVAL